VACRGCRQGTLLRPDSASRSVDGRGAAPLTRGASSTSTWLNLRPSSLSSTGGVGEQRCSVVDDDDSVHSRVQTVNQVSATSKSPFIIIVIIIIIIKSIYKGKKVRLSHTGYRALGPELIPVYRQSARR